MRTPRLAVLLFGFSIICSSAAVAKESKDESAIHDVLDRFVGACFDGNFSELALVLHPSAQRLFRNELSACWDELQRVYSFEQISAVSGLGSHPKDFQVTDAEFFVIACEQARARHPEIVPDRKFLPFDIRSSTFRHDNRVDIGLSYNGPVTTERTSYCYTMPFIIVFERGERMNWQVVSCPLSGAIAAHWSRDLSSSAAAVR